MDNLISLFFPTAPAGSASSSTKGSSNATHASGGFSPEFFELLQGEISALTAPGKGDITTEDINKLSDTQIEMLGNFLSNVEIDENGNMTLAKADTAAAATGVDILPEKLAAAAPENDPAVLDVLQQIESPATIKAKDGQDDTLLLTFEQLSQHLEQLLNGLPQESRISLVQITPENDPSLGADTNSAANAELIAAGMSPADMLAFIKDLSNNTKAENDGNTDNAAPTGDTGAQQNIMFALLAPAQATNNTNSEEQNVIFLPRGVIISAAARSNNGLGNGTTEQTENQQAASNGRGGENVARALNKALQSLNTTQGSVNNLYSGTANTSADATSSADDFSKVLNMLQQSSVSGDADSDGDGSIRLPQGLDKGLNTALTHAEARAVQTAMQNGQQASAGLSTVPSDMTATGQNMTASPDWSSVFPDGINWSTASAAQQAAGNSVNMATMTSLISQNNAATATHPASQMVAATLTKAGEADNKTLTLRLDPPDLGRVQVKMEMGQDNIVKTIITSEKPHTHMMLQRDAHALERALQDAGLDASADSAVQFELAQDGSLFSDNQGQGGDNFSGGSGGSQADDNAAPESDIIESQMTWDVDPETGYMHYNLVV